MTQFFESYANRKILTVLFLGFSSGLPLLLIGGTLGAWLFESGIDKKSIGMFAWVAIPYSFKFAWAPLVDHLKLPFFTKTFGRRRGWMLATQIVLMGALAMFSQLDPKASVTMIALLAVLVATLAATQDIVIDAYRTEYLDKEQYGEGAASAVFGYRVGMLVAGAGALALADAQTWNIVYLVMAAFMLVGMITVLLAGEPKAPPYEITKPGLKNWIEEAVVMPFRDFAQRHPGWLLILLFILFYRLSDEFIGFMTTPFFLDIGFSKIQIATIAKIYGFGATILGMFIGGALVHRLGVERCLMLFLFTQVITNLGYAVLSMVGPDIYYLMATIAMDNLSGGMITAAAIAYMMGLCNIQYTATQYALLSSLAALASRTVAGGAGWVADEYGWTMMFGLSAFLGLPALVTWMAMKKYR